MKRSNAQYSTDIELIIPLDKNDISKIISLLENAGGIIISLNISYPEKHTKEAHIHLTFSTYSLNKLQSIINTIKSIESIDVKSIKDRTFFAHFGGKISIENKMRIDNYDDLSMIYTPGVARICKDIALNPENAKKFTIKNNTIAIISDGSAVLGLGNIGYLAALPVLEGKAALFKRFANINAFPLCLKTQKIEEIINTIEMIAPNFAGINLEDISAPRCFEIENQLRKILDIPVFHDDQHGTAVVTLASLYNALRVVDKNIQEVKIVISGAGAAGTAIVKILISAGAKNIIVSDIDGVIYKNRKNMNKFIRWIAENTNFENISGNLHDALNNADVFIGVSAANVINYKDILKMKQDSIIFAMANPTPEIDPNIASKYASVVATGRSDFVNQINNVLVFPGFFKGLINAKVVKITNTMLLAAAKALASTIKSEELNANYIIPSVFNEEVVIKVSDAVYKTAEK